MCVCACACAQVCMTVPMCVKMQLSAKENRFATSNDIQLTM